MKKCPYCESELVLINEFNTEDIYDKYGYKMHWYCENESCDTWMVARVRDDELVAYFLNNKGKILKIGVVG